MAACSNGRASRALLVGDDAMLPQLILIQNFGDKLTRWCRPSLGNVATDAAADYLS